MLQSIHTEPHVLADGRTGFIDPQLAEFESNWTGDQRWDKAIFVKKKHVWKKLLGSLMNLTDLVMKFNSTT